MKSLCLRLLLLSAVLVSGRICEAAQNPNQGSITVRVTRPGGAEGIPEVQLLLVGPLTGSAANAAASNPSMIAEIAEGASVPQVSATTGADGRFCCPAIRTR